MTAKETTTATETMMQAFQRGVIDTHVKNSLDTEYASMFWGNCFGDEWESTAEAYDCGVEAVEQTL